LWNDSMRTPSPANFHHGEGVSTLTAFDKNPTLNIGLQS
jgi:hypothetical protein